MPDCVSLVRYLTCYGIISFFSARYRTDWMPDSPSFLYICTVGAKSITCAKTRYDINGHHMSKFLNFLFFLLFYCLLYVRKMILKWKSNNLFFDVMIDTKNYLFLMIFLSPFNFTGGNLFLKRTYIPKTTSPFLGRVIGNFFDDTFIFSVKISTRYGHPAPKVTCFCFTATTIYLKWQISDFFPHNHILK